MTELGQASEHEMIAAFLRGEVDSSRFQWCVNRELSSLGRDRSLIDSPDLTDPLQNAARMSVLSQCRGYPDRFLFLGFPRDASWRRVSFEPQDFDRMRYANVDGLVRLSGGTRRVDVAARSYETNPSPEFAHIGAILADLRNGKVFPALIAAEASDGLMILMEGHSRATAYVIEKRTSGVEAYVASSPSMRTWQFY